MGKINKLPYFGILFQCLKGFGVLVKHSDYMEMSHLGVTGKFFLAGMALQVVVGSDGQ